MADAVPDPADDAVRGVKSLCALLGCSRGTLYALRRRRTDPLRLWSAEHDPTPWQTRSRLVAFRRRWRNPGDPALASSRVDGWLAIAKELPGPRGGHMSVDLAQKLAARDEDPLPVSRTRQGRPFAYREALLDWLDGQTRHHGHRSALVTEKKRRNRAESEAGSERKTVSGDRARRRAEPGDGVKRAAKERRAA